MTSPTSPAPSSASPKKPAPGWLPFAVDFGPLLIFFLAYRLAGGSESPLSASITATGVFMVAILIALIVAKWKLGKVSPMLWLSAVLVIGFGALTIWFHNPAFIQIKPTLIYAFFAVLLLGGWARGKPLLRYLLQHAYDGLNDEGWLKLSRNWGFFFAFLAVANEAMRALLTFDTWLTVKVWGVTAISVIFGMANIPMLMRHGLAMEEAKDASDPPPAG